MPIIAVECVVTDDAERYGSVAVQALADQLGKIFESDPGTTWVRLRYLNRSQYAENEVELDASVKPTFVQVLLRSLPGEAVLEEQARVIAETVSEVLSRPCENVHVLFEPEGVGRIAFGGNLVVSGLRVR